MTHDGLQSDNSSHFDIRERLLTVDEIAKLLNVGDETVRKFVANGMPAYKFGHRTLRFDKARVLAWLDANHSSQPAIAGLPKPEGSPFSPSGTSTAGAGTSPLPAPVTVEDVA
jgi:excisionase family DNA binding protein